MDTSLTTAEFEKGLTRKGIIATKHLADTLNECYAEFWQRDKQTILDSINGNLVATLERFAANSQLGAAVNSQLEKTDIATRVILTMPTGYSFNGTEFIYTAPIVESLAPIENEV
jgi:hypothetical protein